MHTEHDAPNRDVNPESLKQGYEPDKINVRLILYVPVAIFFTFVLAYVVVTVIIDNLREGHKTPGENLPATARNEAAMNDQLSRISSTNPKADVRQPRLEGLNELIKDGQSVQSNVPTKEGNSVQYHPEDLRPSAERWKILQEYGWRDKSKDIVRIPIMEAIKVLMHGKMTRMPATRKQRRLLPRCSLSLALTTKTRSTCRPFAPANRRHRTLNGARRRRRPKNSLMEADTDALRGPSTFVLDRRRSG